MTAVKQAMPDLEQARRIVEETELVLYAGDNELLMPMLELGAAGGICVASHVAGREFRRMIDLAQAGDIEGARAVDAGLQELFRALAVTTNPIPIKAAMNLMGFDAGGLRLPLVEADEAETRVVAAALEAAGLLSVSA